MNLHNIMISNPYLRSLPAFEEKILTKRNEYDIAISNFDKKQSNNMVLQQLDMKQRMPTRKHSENTSLQDTNAFQSTQVYCQIEAAN